MLQKAVSDEKGHQLRPLTILDFGCGKSYLTFAIHYFLKEKSGMQVEIVGLDLKTDVISRCRTLAEKLQCEGLTFLQGDIAHYMGHQTVDLVVSLHACDTATDYALAKAITWGAQVILSVPCCQHEVNRQIEQPLLWPLLKHGLLKERISALCTDGIRAAYLETKGYKTQVIEFIDMEHTPKNILLRAIRQPGFQKDPEELNRLCSFLQVETTLQKLNPCPPAFPSKAP